MNPYIAMVGLVVWFLPLYAYCARWVNGKYQKHMAFISLAGIIIIGCA